MRTLSLRLLLCITIPFFLVNTSRAQTLYATGESVQKLFKVDMSTGEVTTLTSLTNRPDSLIVDSLGRILFTTGGPAGTVSMFDPSTGLVSAVASGLSYPRDLIFDPGQTTILVSNFGRAQIVRVSLVTGTVTPLISKLGSVDGLAYDPTGHLFAVVSHHKQVIQIDPSSGAILKTLTVITNPPVGWYGLDGLTYDSYTGQLWAADVGSGTNCASGANCLVEIPTDLSSFTFFQQGTISAPDGIISDGKGNLFVGVGAAAALEYNIPTNTVAKTVKVPSIDDVALAPVTTPPDVKLYATGESVQQLFKVDMSTGGVTPLASLANRPDSLIVDSLGRILFTTGGSAGTVSMFDPSTSLVSLVASGLSYPRDLIFDPGQTTILVSNFGLGQIVRVSLVTGTVAPLTSKLGTVDGLAYDAAGHLFAVVGHHKQVIQIDPSSGAILKTLNVITNPPYGWYGLDGLTYDSYTGQLWVADVGSGTDCATGANCLVEIPTDLSSFTFFQQGTISSPDGIISDGKGNLFVGVGAAAAMQYSIPTDTVVRTVKVPSIDDVALAPANLAF